MSDAGTHRGIRRRELALWILLAAEASGIDVDEACRRLEEHIVGSAEPDLRPPAMYRPQRFDDFLPTQADWMQFVEGSLGLARLYESHRGEVDELIARASPRWRLDRMPPIDRSLLRLGCAEMIFSTERRLPTVFHCLIELAKRYGEDSTHRFVNGILDQIRKDRGLGYA